MQKIVAISRTFGSEFMIETQKLLDEGYKIQSSNCGVINYVDGSSDTIYQAILLKEG